MSCDSICSTWSVFSSYHVSPSSILYVILFTVSPTLVNILNTEAEEMAAVELALGSSPSHSRKSTRSESSLRTGWRVTRVMNLSSAALRLVTK